MKKILLLLPIFLLLTINQLIVLNVWVGSFDNGLAETNVLLPGKIGSEDIRYIFDTPVDTYVYKVVLTGKICTIYTNDLQFYKTFNLLSSNGKNLFIQKYEVYNEPPTTMQGEFYVGNGTDEYINGLQSHFNNKLQVSEVSESGIVYYIMYLLRLFIINVIFFAMCLLYYLSQFERDKRKLLLCELNGNQTVMDEALHDLRIQIMILYGVISYLVFKVNTILELIIYLVLLCLMIIISFLITFLIKLVYKRLITKSYLKSVQINSSIYCYLYLGLIVIFTMLSISNYTNLSKYSIEYITNYQVMKGKPEEYRQMYQARTGLSSEINFDSLGNLSEYDGYYVNYEKDFGEVNVNCKYAIEYLNFDTCNIGTYTHGEVDDNETYSQDIEVNSFDLLVSVLINPTIKIVDDSELMTSDIFWESRPDIDYLDIETTETFYKQAQANLRFYIGLFLSKTLVFIMLVSSLIIILIRTYHFNYGQSIAMKKLHGRRVYISYIYYAFGFAMVGITSTFLVFFTRGQYFRCEFYAALLIIFCILQLVNHKVTKVTKNYLGEGHD